MARSGGGWSLLAGAKLGYPGLVLDPQGRPVEVHLFESSQLPGHLRRLDEFEGAGYRRVVTQVQTANGESRRVDLCPRVGVTRSPHIRMDYQIGAAVFQNDFMTSLFSPRPCRARD
jgi:hypothetical protein